MLARLQELLDLGVRVEISRNLRLQSEPGRKLFLGSARRNLGHRRFRSAFVVEPNATELLRLGQRLP